MTAATIMTPSTLPKTTPIKETCPDCGDVEISPESNVYVVFHKKPGVLLDFTCVIHFTCPNSGCRMAVDGIVGRGNAIKLVSAGVAAYAAVITPKKPESPASWADELQDFARRPTAERLLTDDLLDFMNELKTTHYIARTDVS